MNHSACRIERATIDDADAVRTLLAQLGYLVDVERLVRTLRLVLDDPSAAVLIARDRDGAVALVSMDLHPRIALGGLVATLDEVVVAERARGRGIGRAIVAEAVRRARDAGAVRIELHTRRTRDAYRRGFYVKNGFVEVDSAVMRMEGAVIHTAR
jgi:GNAT superfamily N-acetyltransferase